MLILTHSYDARCTLRCHFLLAGTQNAVFDQYEMMHSELCWVGQMQEILMVIKLISNPTGNHFAYCYLPFNMTAD